MNQNLDTNVTNDIWSDQYTATISKLVVLKDRILTANQKKQDEIYCIKSEINEMILIKETLFKEQMQQNLALHKLKVELMESNQKMACWSEYVDRSSETINNSIAGIDNELDFESFETYVNLLRDKYIGLINLYSEDNLLLEFEKRKTECRNKRIELTQIDSKIEKLKAKIEENIQAEMLRIEEERRREEQQKRDQELELARLAREAKMKDSFRDDKFKPHDTKSIQPTGTQINDSTTSSTIKPRAEVSPIEQKIDFSRPNALKEGEEAVLDFSFSQMF